MTWGAAYIQRHNNLPRLLALRMALREMNQTIPGLPSAKYRELDHWGDCRLRILAHSSPIELPLTSPAKDFGVERFQRSTLVVPPRPRAGPAGY